MSRTTEEYLKLQEKLNQCPIHGEPTNDTCEDCQEIIDYLMASMEWVAQEDTPYYEDNLVIIH